MSDMNVNRRLLPDGKTQLSAGKADFLYERLRPGAMLITVLVGSKAIELTVAIAQHLSQTGNLIQIYTDSDLFGARVAAARA